MMVLDCAALSPVLALKLPSILAVNMAEPRGGQKRRPTHEAGQVSPIPFLPFHVSFLPMPIALQPCLDRNVCTYVSIVFLNNRFRIVKSVAKHLSCRPPFMAATRERIIRTDQEGIRVD